jgi:hypothetical protein
MLTGTQDKRRGDEEKKLCDLDQNSGMRRIDAEKLAIL